jgi:hypothetical protein
MNPKQVRSGTEPSDAPPASRPHRSTNHTPTRRSPSHGVSALLQPHAQRGAVTQGGGSLSSSSSSSSSASPPASHTASISIPIDDHRSVGSTFWQGWLKYRQTMQEKAQNMQQNKKGHCDRFYPFWSLFGFTAVSFASLVGTIIGYNECFCGRA